MTGDWHPPAPPPLPGHNVCCPKTTPPQATREQAAREWLISRGLTHRNGAGRSVVEDEDLRDLVKLLSSTEARVLEEAAQYLEDNKIMSPHIGPLWNAGWTEAANHFAAEFKRKAQERTP